MKEKILTIIITNCVLSVKHRLDAKTYIGFIFNILIVRLLQVLFKHSNLVRNRAEDSQFSHNTLKRALN